MKIIIYFEDIHKLKCKYIFSTYLKIKLIKLIFCLKCLYLRKKNNYLAINTPSSIIGMD